MRADVFVHPMHNRDTFPEVYFSEFERILVEEFTKSDMPFIMSPEYCSNLLDRRDIPKSQICDEAATVLRGNYICFVPRDLDFANEFYKKIASDDFDEVRVHGIYFGQCTLHVAKRLFLYENKREIKNFRFSDEDYDFLKKSEIRGDFRKSKIKLGAVLHPPDFIPIEFPNDDLPYGNSIYQFMDSNTDVIGYEFYAKICEEKRRKKMENVLELTN